MITDCPGESAPELSVAIPLYNEEGNIRLVAERLASVLDAAKVNYELVLVNNGSADGTGAHIRDLAEKNPRIRCLQLEVNQGYGGGILAGLHECRGKFVGYTWGDNQVRAEDLLLIFERLKRERLDLCKSRRIERHDGFARWMVTRIYNGLFPLVFPIYVRDINGCPKLMRREIFRCLDLTSKDWFLDPEIIIKACEKKLGIGEVPVIFHAREKGKTKVRWQTVFEFLKNMIRYRLQPSSERAILPAKTL